MTPTGWLLFPSSICVQVKGHPSREKNERSYHTVSRGFLREKRGLGQAPQTFCLEEGCLCVVYLSQVYLSLADGIILPQGDF